MSDTSRQGDWTKPAAMAIPNGQRTLRKPCATSSIYEYAPYEGRTAHPSINFRRPTLNLQHPARSRATAISLCVAPRRPRAAWHALREFWACARPTRSARRR